jgi:uncharacterized membrane protein YcaP (DUF421 family)
MIAWSGITTSWDSLRLVLISTVVIYIVLMLYTRLAGLRSFSKMSSFDFAVTIAIGSTVASVILTREPPLLLGLVGLGLLYALQITVAMLRYRCSALRSLVDNSPLLLMQGDRFLEANMRKAKITRADLMAKLREANVLNLSQVRAVVMESTGDISVLHAESSSIALDSKLMENVQGYNQDDT